jgi:hypothetical protein
MSVCNSKNDFSDKSDAVAVDDCVKPIIIQNYPTTSSQLFNFTVNNLYLKK